MNTWRKLNSLTVKENHFSTDSEEWEVKSRCSCWNSAVRGLRRTWAHTLKHLNYGGQERKLRLHRVKICCRVRKQRSGDQVHWARRERARKVQRVPTRREDLAGWESRGSLSSQVMERWLEGSKGTDCGRSQRLEAASKAKKGRESRGRQRVVAPAARTLTQRTWLPPGRAPAPALLPPSACGRAGGLRR